MKRVIALAMAVLMSGSVLAGCGGGDSSSAASSNSTVPADPSKPYAGTVVKYATTDTAATAGEQVELVEMVKEKTGIEIEFTIIPKAATGEVDKTLVSLQAGDPIDLIYGTTSQLKPFYNAGVLTSLDEMAAADNYDMEAIFGSNLPKFDDGKTYGLPAFNDIWITYYNKQIFDEAGVAYPDPETWTWEKYIETAQQLTDPEKNIYGSMMLDYDNYNFFYAQQNGAEFYKEDGTANFDDPRFTESVEWFYSLGNDLKIQPTITEMVSKVYPWNSFAATGVANEDGTYDNTRFAMFICGGWAASMLPNSEQYPRDWECGIAPFPYPEGQEPSTLAVTGCYAIPSTSKNKEAAFEALKCIAENQYTLGYGRVPARVDLTDEVVDKYIEENLVPSFEANDHITAEEFKAAWFDPERTILPEKIVGTADTTISQIWVEEARLYGQGQQELEKSMQNIQERSNKAIAEEKASR